MKNIDHRVTIIIAAFIIGLFIFISNGIYSFHSPTRGVVYKGNKITGSVSICLWSSGCELFRRK